MISFKTSGLSGDIIHYLAGIKQVCEENKTQADIYVWLDQPCFLYEGAEHPYGQLMMNRYAFDMMKPLAEAQPYVNSFQEWSGQKILVDLDLIREVKINMPHGSLSRWIFYRFPDMTAPLHEPWLTVGRDILYIPGIDDQWAQPPGTTNKRKILINRTSRYRNPWISYFFLEQYRDDIAFVGLPQEHKQFCEEWKFEFDMPYIKVENFYELAYEINSCKFFLGNQSMCYAIAEALKVPRILEVCQFAPNVIPTGPGAHDFTSQAALIYFVDKLYNQ